MRQVGVIGTGAMGMGVVRSLIRHHVRTYARDIRPEAQAQAARLGAIPAESARALARSSCHPTSFRTDLAVPAGTKLVP